MPQNTLVNKAKQRQLERGGYFLDNYTEPNEEQYEDEDAGQDGEFSPTDVDENWDDLDDEQLQILFEKKEKEKKKEEEAKKERLEWRRKMIAELRGP